MTIVMILFSVAFLGKIESARDLMDSLASEGNAQPLSNSLAVEIAPLSQYGAVLTSVLSTLNSLSSTAPAASTALLDLVESHEDTISDLSTYTSNLPVFAHAHEVVFTYKLRNITTLNILNSNSPFEPQTSTTETYMNLKAGSVMAASFSSVSTTELETAETLFIEYGEFANDFFPEIVSFLKFAKTEGIIFIAFSGCLFVGSTITFVWLCLISGKVVESINNPLTLEKLKRQAISERGGIIVPFAGSTGPNFIDGIGNNSNVNTNNYGNSSASQLIAEPAQSGKPNFYSNRNIPTMQQPYSNQYISENPHQGDLGFVSLPGAVEEPIVRDNTTNKINNHGDNDQMHQNGNSDTLAIDPNRLQTNPMMMTVLNDVDTSVNPYFFSLFGNQPGQVPVSIASVHYSTQNLARNNNRYNEAPSSPDLINAASAFSAVGLTMQKSKYLLAADEEFDRPVVDVSNRIAEIQAEKNEASTGGALKKDQIINIDSVRDELWAFTQVRNFMWLSSLVSFLLCCFGCWVLQISLFQLPSVTSGYGSDSVGVWAVEDASTTDDSQRKRVQFAKCVWDGETALSTADSAAVDSLMEDLTLIPAYSTNIASMQTTRTYFDAIVSSLAALSTPTLSDFVSYIVSSITSRYSADWSSPSSPTVVSDIGSTVDNACSFALELGSSLPAYTLSGASSSCQSSYCVSNPTLCTTITSSVPSKSTIDSDSALRAVRDAVQIAEGIVALQSSQPCDTVALMLLSSSSETCIDFLQRYEGLLSSAASTYSTDLNSGVTTYSEFFSDDVAESRELWAQTGVLPYRSENSANHTSLKALDGTVSTNFVSYSQVCAEVSRTLKLSLGQLSGPCYRFTYSKDESQVALYATGTESTVVRMSAAEMGVIVGAMSLLAAWTCWIGGIVFVGIAIIGKTRKENGYFFDGNGDGLDDLKGTRLNGTVPVPVVNMSTS